MSIKQIKKMIDKKLLDILVCPLCKKELILEKEELLCKNCKKAYPIKNNIPVLIIGEARNLINL